MQHQVRAEVVAECIGYVVTQLSLPTPLVSQEVPSMSMQNAENSPVSSYKVIGVQWQTPPHTRQTSCQRLGVSHLAALYSPQRVQRHVQQAKQLLQATLQGS